eukprot:8541076-Pyramimonas_sp.AAC.1
MSQSLERCYTNVAESGAVLHKRHLFGLLASLGVMNTARPQVEGTRVLAAELGVRAVRIVRSANPFAHLATDMHEESFELIRDAVPANVRLRRTQYAQY